MESKELAFAIAKMLDDKKGMNIKIIKIDEISTLADYFVIATGTSNTHVKALSDEVEYKLKGEGNHPMGVEGYNSNSWILIDYAQVVVHVFTPEGREFYDLDRLWQDGKEVEVNFEVQ